MKGSSKCILAYAYLGAQELNVGHDLDSETTIIQCIMGSN